MVIDSSAIIAILFDEPERATFLERLADAPTKLLSQVNYVESCFVILSRIGAAGLADLTGLLHQADIERVAVDDQQAELAVEAFSRFGKGRHPAGLNIGDCFAYALAKSRGETLLFKGNDFGRTDIAIA